MESREESRGEIRRDRTCRLTSQKLSWATSEADRCTVPSARLTCHRTAAEGHGRAMEGWWNGHGGPWNGDGRLMERPRKVVKG